MGFRRSFGVRVALGRLTLVCALVLGGVVQASSANAQDELSKQPSKPCWVNLDRGLSLCVDAGENLADAVLARHGILLESEDKVIAPSALALASSERKDFRPLKETVIGVLFEHEAYRGYSLVVTVTGNSCSGAVFVIPNLVASGWNNRISSFKSYSNCRTTIFEDFNFKGARLSGINTRRVGRALNDLTSSVRWVAR